MRAASVSHCALPLAVALCLSSAHGQDQPESPGKYSTGDKVVVLRSTQGEFVAACIVDVTMVGNVTDYTLDYKNGMPTAVQSSDEVRRTTLTIPSPC